MDNKSTGTKEVYDDDKIMLSRVQLFRNVEINKIQGLLDQCEYRILENDEILLTPDQSNNHLYVVMSGRLMVYLQDNEDEALTSVEPGECVGEMSIIDSKTPSASVKATDETRVLAIEQEILWRLVSASHEVARNLLYILAERVRYSNLVISDSRELQRRYQRFATIDALTGLHNRGWLDDMFEREVKRSARDELPLILIMIDVDHFKNYNDKHGHQAGDYVLRRVGELIRQPLRPNDMIARYGGEEFSVLLPETTVDNAMMIAERLREYVSEAVLGAFEGKPLSKVTISLGLASNSENSDLKSLISAADSAMYRAKENGRNCVVI